MISFLGPILVSIAGALAFVAYKHPDSYAHLLTPIRFCGAIAVFGIFGWEIGGKYVFDQLKPIVGPASLPAATSAVEPMMDMLSYILFASMGAWFYAEMLQVLPLMGIKAPEHDNRKH